MRGLVVPIAIGIIPPNGGIGQYLAAKLRYFYFAIAFFRYLVTLLRGNAFAMNGTVREARGLASITYTFSFLMANWILRRPIIFISKASFSAYSSILACTSSLRLKGGSTALESPE